MQDDWRQQLNRLMDDYESPVPDDLWERIEAQLPPAAPVEPVHRHLVPLWARYAAAAAAVGLLAVVNFWPAHEHVESSPVVAQQTVPSQYDESSATSADEQVVEHSHPSKRRGGAAAHEQEASTVPPDDAAEPSPQAEAPAQAEPATTAGQHDSHAPTVVPTRKEPDAVPSFPTRHRQKQAVTLGLLAQNVVGQGDMGRRQSSEPVMMSPAYSNAVQGNSPRFLTRAETFYLSDYEERAKHRQPVSIGLAVSYPLTECLALQSGLVYTQVRSDFTHILGQQQTVDVQRLYYIGVPLRLSCDLLQFGAVKLYGTVGGQADWNVRATVTTDGSRRSIGRDRLQLSAEAAVGAQVEVVPRVSVYAEPGARYYFDNGSRLQNVFKDQPLSFSLQFGFRVNLR